jgi:hypothetical protein
VLEHVLLDVEVGCSGWRLALWLGNWGWKWQLSYLE